MTLKRKKALKSKIEFEHGDLEIQWRRNKVMDKLAEKFAKLTGQKLEY